MTDAANANAAHSITYWIEWCRYIPSEDGCRTHAVPEPGAGRALCGVRTTEAGGGIVGIDGEPGCIRCSNALKKLGLLDLAGRPTAALAAT